jgi:hypothetical protein
VVLVDFWTYTCVNWLRTLPYRRAWAAKYADTGLAVIGVHTPEFEFERDVENVVNQARALGVEYPIAIDSDYAIWRAFGNHFWPALYIADEQGRIRYHHFGEGEYAMAEMVVQQLLSDAGATNLDLDLVSVEPRGLEIAADWHTLRSPETYLGYGQATGFASRGVATFDRPQQYHAQPSLRLNSWDLSGNWTIRRDAVVLNEPGGRIAFGCHARDVNLVMGPASDRRSVPYRVFIDGEGGTGSDVDARGHGNVGEQRTYQLARQTGPIVERRFEIQFLEAGVEAYCFTFG